MAGSVTTYTKNYLFRNGGDIYEEHLWSWTADDTTGAITSKASDDIINGEVVHAETNPGATAPTANYDITISNANAVDIMGGELGDRSASVSEQAMPKMGSAYGDRVVNSVLTFAAANNSVNSATGTCKVIVRRRK
jgi:hypothetical protein